MTAPIQAPPSLGLLALALAQAELARGVREDDGPNRDKAGRIAMYRAPSVRDGRRVYVFAGKPDPWCACFVSWCMWVALFVAAGEDEADAADSALSWSPFRFSLPSDHPDPPIGYRASVAELIADARATGAWRDMQADETPGPGDLVCFARDGQDPRTGGHGHVAIVERWSPVDGHAVISGNDGDAVRRREWDAGDAPPWPWVGWIRLG